MKPILYREGETSFDTNGIGILSDAISCTVTESINGIYTLEMEYPIDGIHFSEITDRSIILALAHPGKRTQPFEVYASTAPMNGIVRFYANHISYALEGEAVDPFVANSAPAAMEALSSKSVKANNFTFWTDKQTVATMELKHPAPIRSILAGSPGSILNTYGGEYEFDRYDVKLWNRRGADRGVTIRYGKNLTDINQERNISNVYTCVYPFWMGQNNSLITLADKLVTVPGTFSSPKILTLDLSNEFVEAPTQDQLRTRTEQYISDNNVGVPDVSISLSFVVLSQTEEYKHMALLEHVEMGDTVSVEFAKLGISTTAKAVKTVCNSLLERYDKIEVGSVRANVASAIVQQGHQIQQAPTRTDLEKVMVATLIAQMLKSTLGTSELFIDGASLQLISEGKVTAELNNATDGMPTFQMLDYFDGAIIRSLALSPQGLRMGGSGTGRLFALDFDDDNRPRFTIGEDGTPRCISWQPNSDGTFTLIGN